MLQGSTSVAVKFVRGHSPKEQARFRNEVGILKSLRHTNIVQARPYLTCIRIACHAPRPRYPQGQLGAYPGNSRCNVQAEINNVQTGLFVWMFQSVELSKNARL